MPLCQEVWIQQVINLKFNIFEYLVEKTWSNVQ